MRAKQENIKLEQNNTTSQYRIYSQKAAMVMKTRYKIAGLAVVAVAGSLLLGGSLWLWLVGLLVGKFVIRVVFTIALALVIYCLIYILIIGGIFWLLIS